MPTQVQLRRGTTVEHSTFTGAVGEITVDTTKDTVVVHDGTTAGGIPLAKESALSGLVTADSSTVFTNKTINLSSNTLAATKAQLDAAVSDGNVVYTDAIGSSVQAYDADTAKTDVQQNWTASQRSAIITDNDGSFDLSALGNIYFTRLHDYSVLIRIVVKGLFAWVTICLMCFVPGLTPSQNVAK